MIRTCLNFLLGLAVLLVGCVASLQPLYTEKDLIFDPALLGLWAEDGSKESWRFEKDGDQAYRLVYSEGDKKGEFKVHLLKLGENRFLDLFPEETGLKEANRVDFYNFHFIPVHTFIKVMQVTPVLQMAVMKNEWFEELVKKDPKAIQHEKVGDRLVLSASTQDLQAWVLKHVRTEEAWGESTKLKRQNSDPTKGGLKP